MKRSLGQNFLGDPNILKKIIDIVPKDLPVLEIGTGSGILTKGLAQSIVKPIISYEIDEATYNEALLNLSPFRHVTLLHADYLKSDVAFNEPYVVIANIPYYITSPIIEKCLDNPWVTGLYIMVQKEIADRIVAKPNEKDYSRFSVFCQTRARVNRCFPVSRHCFFPVPRVDSTFIALHPSTEWTRRISDISLYNKIIRGAFWGKRKTISSCLSRSPYLLLGADMAREVLSAAGIDPQHRGETLAVSEYVRIVDALVQIRLQI